uniref:Nuclear pore complex protein Nup88 n=1 Tax=Heterorhabditis bacteriophora TaxID=37862 RepID=A0A1I7XDR6_HETBA
MNRTTQCMDLTSGLPREKITSIEFVDRSPYFLYGTFDGRVGMVKVNFHDGDMSTSFEKRILWRDKDPVISLRVSQLDNAFVALISYNSITKMYSMNVIDIIGEKKETLDPVVVLRVHSSETMLDICWLWDHPCRLILSINGSIRLFDVRNALYTEQSLFFDGGLTLVASNKFRTHQFAGYNGFEVLIFDSRNLFGPVKQFSVSQAGQIGLHSLKWNPYIPDELLLHFNGSNDILRCSIKNSDVDPFKVRTSFFKFSPCVQYDLTIFDFVRYVASSEIHVLLRYGEQYDLCKTNQDVDLPLFWSSPKQQYLNDAASHPFSTEESPKDSGMLHSLHARQHAMNKSVSEPAIFPHSFLDVFILIIRVNCLVILLSFIININFCYLQKIILPFNHEDSYSNRLASSSFPLSDPELLPKPFPRCSLDTEVYCSCTESFSKFWMTYEKPLKKLFEDIGISPDDDAEMFELEQYLQIILKERNINLTEDGDSFVISLLSKMGIFPDDNGTSAMYANLMRVLGKDNLTCKNNSTQTENLNSEYYLNSANSQDSTLRMGDDGQKIKLATPTISFDFAPVGYSGIIHLTIDGKTPKFQFTPFITADETVTIFPEHITILDDIKKSEVRDTMPTYLYNIMKERLKLGMNKIDLNNPLLLEINDASEVIYDEETENDKQENYTVPVLNMETMLKVKGFPGLLQLCSLDAKEITDWKPFDSDLFSNYSVSLFNFIYIVHLYQSLNI